MVSRKTRAKKATSSTRRRASTKPTSATVLKSKAAANVTENKPKLVTLKDSEISICFREAVIKFKANKITRDEYLQAVVAHCTGLRHGENQQCNGDSDGVKARDGSRRKFASNLTEGDDLFAYTMMKWIHFDVCQRGKQVKDTEPIFNVLQAFLSNSIPDFKRTIKSLMKAYPILPRDRPTTNLRTTLLTSLLKFIIYDDNDPGDRSKILQIMLTTDEAWMQSLFKNLEYEQALAYLTAASAATNQHHSQKATKIFAILSKYVRAPDWRDNPRFDYWGGKLKPTRDLWDRDDFW